MGNRKAFTIVELIVVVAIIGVLLAVTVPNMLKARGTTIEDTCKTSRKEVKKIIYAWGVKEDLSIAEMQSYYGDAPLGSKVASGARDKGVVEDGYLDAKDAYCPANPGEAAYEYSAWVLDSGKVVILCPTHGH